MLSAETCEALREMLRKFTANTEEEAERLYRCWVEIRENEQKPRRRPKP